MTRSMNQRLQCPNCGTLHTHESPFERWMRNHRLLDSETGVVRFDLDVLIHKYKTLEDKFGGRTVQAMMFIEVKAMNADPTMAQLDTLHLFSQVLRNRRPNRHRGRQGKHADNHVAPAKAFSKLLNRNVSLWLFGGHLLTMEGESPETSQWLKWDYKAIGVDQLVQLLRFEIYPDNLRPIDWRRRSYTQQTLFLKR